MKGIALLLAIHYFVWRFSNYSKVKKLKFLKFNLSDESLGSRLEADYQYMNNY